MANIYQCYFLKNIFDPQCPKIDLFVAEFADFTPQTTSKTSSPSYKYDALKSAGHDASYLTVVMNSKANSKCYTLKCHDIWFAF